MAWKTAGATAFLIVAGGCVDPGEAGPLQVARRFNRSGHPLAIRCLAPDSEGFLWAGASTGLFRFDGIHFHAITSQPVNSVAVTTDGWVWAGGERGLIAVRHAEVRHILTQRVKGLASRGTQVIVNAGELFQGDLQGLKPLNIQVNGALSVDGQNRIWFGCEREVCDLGVDGKIRRWGANEGMLAHLWVGAIADDDGSIWAWDESRTFRIAEKSVAMDDSFGYDHPAYRSPNGRIWLGLVWADPARTFTSRVRQPQGGLYSATYVEDKHSNGWVASTEPGVYLISPRTWVRTWGFNLFSTGCESVTRIASGRLIAATGKGFAEFDSRTESWHPMEKGLSKGFSWAAADASNGNVWTISQDSGIFRFDRTGKQTGAIFTGSFYGLDFRRFFRDRAGLTWVGAKAGLYQIDEASLKLRKAGQERIGRNPIAFANGPDPGVDGVRKRHRPAGERELAHCSAGKPVVNRTNR